MAFTNPKRPPTLLSPDAAVAVQNPETLERELIFGCIKSIRFYRQARNIICPYNPLTRMHRRDFSVSRYNTLYEAVDRWWRRFGHAPMENDQSVPPHLLSAYLFDWCNKNTIARDTTEFLVKEIHEEIPLAAEITFESSSALLQSDGFRVWLERRLVNRALVRLASHQSLGTLTLESLEKVVEDARAGLVGVGREAPKLLGELVAVPEDDASVLLGPRRFLSRGGLMLLVGQTGVGKSTFSLQMVIKFSLGREFFGMKPNGTLKTLIVQSENDDGEILEFRDGIFNALQLSNAERSQAGKMIMVKTSLGTSGAEFASKVLAPGLASFRPDLVLIDPALAFLGGDSKEQADVGKFLRVQLMPLLQRFGCACILVHHTNKPAAGKNQSTGNWHDQAYAGSGSSEWANAARAVITLKSTEMDGIFEFSVPKRGNRLEWRNQDGSRRMSRFIRHSREAGEICWYEVSQAELDQAQSESVQEHTAAVDDDVYQAIAAREDGIAKNELAAFLKPKGHPARVLDASLVRLVQSESITKKQVPRPGVRPEIWYVVAGPVPHRNGNGKLETLPSPG